MPLPSASVSALVQLSVRFWPGLGIVSAQSLITYAVEIFSSSSSGCSAVYARLANL